MNKNILLAKLISFFSALYFYLPIMTLWYQSRGLSLFQVESLSGIIVATIFLANIPTGVFADKLGRKTSVIIALVCQLLGEIFYLYSQSYLMFAISCIVAGLGFAFLTGAFEALIFDTLKNDDKTQDMKKIMGEVGSSHSLATVIAAALSGLVVTSLSPSHFAQAIKLTIGSVIIALIISFFLKEPKKSKQATSQNPFQMAKSGLKSIATQPTLRRLVILTVIATPLGLYLQTLYPVYFVKANVPSQWFGPALALAGIIEMLALKYAYKIENWLGPKPALLIFTLLPGLLYLVMASVFSPILSTILFIANYGLMELQTPLFSSYLNEHAPSTGRATFLSTVSTITSAYIALVGLAIGRLADISISFPFIFIGLIIVAGALIFRLEVGHPKTA